MLRRCVRRLQRGPAECRLIPSRKYSSSGEEEEAQGKLARVPFAYSVCHASVPKL